MHFEAPARLSLAGRVGVALAAAVSLASALALPAPAVAATSVGQSACNEREVLTDSLLRRGYRNRPIPPGVRQQVQRDLGSVAPEILRTLDASRVGVVVLAKGQTPEDVGVIRSTTVQGYMGDLKALRSTVDRIRAGGDPAVKAEIADLQARVTGEDYDEESAMLRGRLAELKSQRADEFFTRVMDETSGRAIARTPLPEEGFFTDMRAGIEALTVRELAEEHGARTPEQVATFARLLKDLNGPALEQAQRAFAEAQGTEGGGELDRPFQPYLEGIVMPGIHFQKDRVVSAHDAVAQATWKVDPPRGQYFYEGGVNTVVLSHDALSRPEEGRSVVVHELGHALEDALQEQSPKAFQSYRAGRDAAWKRLSESGNFPTDYSGASPQEMAADSFAADGSGQRARLKSADARWDREFGRMLDTARALGDKQPSRCEGL